VSLNNLLLILFLISMVALVIGVVKPNLVIKWGSQEKRNRKSVLKYYGLSLIVSFILFGMTSPDEEVATTTAKTTEKAKDKATENKKKELTPEEKAAKEKAAADKIAAEEKAVADKKAAEEKAAAEKIAEVKAAAEKAAADQAAKERAAAEKAAKEEAERIGYETGITYDQLARTPDDFEGKKAKFSGRVVQVMEGDGETQLRIAVDDNYDTILFVAYESTIISSRVLEDDFVTISGESLGLITYQSTMGGDISIPAMEVTAITINN
jgi:flagellar biosynthesis GTPase FlhF